MLSPDQVLDDAMAVLREKADAATPGHRTGRPTTGTATVHGLADGQLVARFRSEADVSLWYSTGPSEARLVAEVLHALAVDMRCHAAVEVAHPDGGWVVTIGDHADAPIATNYPEWTAALALARAVTGHAGPGDTP